MSYDKKCHKVHVLWTLCVNGLRNKVCIFESGIYDIIFNWSNSYILYILMIMIITSLCYVLCALLCMHTIIATGWD